MSARLTFAVYAIENDNFTGRLDVRPSFRKLGSSIERTHDDLTGLVSADTMDGGLIGTITAPEGTTLGETQAGNPILCLPGGATLDAVNAMIAAKSEYRSQSFGLGWSPAK